MASVNINDEKRLIVSIKDISSLNTSVGETQTVSTDTSDINYVPGYVEAEKQRRKNETERIENENKRKSYYESIQEKVNNGEFKGEKGDKGDKGEDGAPGQSGATDYNELQNKPLIPTKTSELVNDSNFINSSDLDSKQDKLIAGPNIVIEDNVISSTGGGGTTGTTNYSDLINKPKINGTTLSGDKTLLELGIQEKGDYLESESDPIYTADKPNIALKTELFSKNYNDLTNKPTIPTKISQIENDKNYITGYTETDPLYVADKPNLALKSELFSGNYSDLTNKPDIPTKISELENDTGYLTKYVEEDPVYNADKANIALKTELFSKNYNELINKPTSYINEDFNYFDLEDGVYIINADDIKITYYQNNKFKDKSYGDVFATSDIEHEIDISTLKNDILVKNSYIENGVYYSHGVYIGSNCSYNISCQNARGELTPIVDRDYLINKYLSQERYNSYTENTQMIKEIHNQDLLELSDGIYYVMSNCGFKYDEEIQDYEGKIKDGTYVVVTGDFKNYKDAVASFYIFPTGEKGEVIPN